MRGGFLVKIVPSESKVKIMHGEQGSVSEVEDFNLSVTTVACAWTCSMSALPRGSSRALPCLLSRVFVHPFKA